MLQMKLQLLAFLEGKITFLQIETLIEKALNHHQVIANPDLKTIQEIDQINTTMDYFIFEKGVM